MNDIQGFLLIDKPAGVSSYACITALKELLQLGSKPRVKIGHAGTLDTFATGLLVVGISRDATRLMRVISTLDKVYLATGKWGEQTDSLDKTGTIVQTVADNLVTEEKIAHAVQALGRQYEQVPPVCSALKFEGKRLSDRMRVEDDTLDLHQIARWKARTVELHAIEIINIESPLFTLRAHVSHGTYIRSLLHDIAQYSQSYATTYELRREAIGPLKLAHAIALDDLNSVEIIENSLISVERMLADLRVYTNKKIW